MNRLTLSPDYSLEIITESEITDELAENFVKSFNESVYSSLSDFTLEQARQQLKRLTTNTDCIVIVLFKHDTPVGHLVGQTLDQHPFLSGRIAFEIAWWVNPNHRSKYSLKLVDAYEYWAKMKGCNTVLLSSSSNEYRESLDKVYKRKGYTSLEQTYVKEI